MSTELIISNNLCKIQKERVSISEKLKPPTRYSDLPNLASPQKRKVKLWEVIKTNKKVLNVFMCGKDKKAKLFLKKETAFYLPIHILDPEPMKSNKIGERSIQPAMLPP